MARTRVSLGSLVIADGGTDSTVLGSKQLDNCVGLLFLTPALTAAVNIRVGPSESSLIAAMTPIFSGATEVALASGVASYWPISGFRSVAGVSEGAEGAERTIPVYAVLDI